MFSKQNQTQSSPHNGNGADEKQKNLRLIALREWFDMSQGQFARFLNRNQPEFSLMEKGERTPPYIELAATTAVNVNWLLGVSDEMWDYRVHNLRTAVRAALVSLPPEERREMKSPVYAQADHIKRIIGIAKAIDADLMTDHLILALLQMDETEYEEKMVKESTHMERCNYVLFCEYLGLPFDLVELGATESLDDSGFDEYRMIVARLATKGITPGKLAKFYESLP